MPEPLKNNRGLKNYIPDMPSEPKLASVFGFVGYIVNTMQNWRDQVQIGMPGYRDRIVHVCHSDDEGGMNLNMKKKIIEDLAEGGAGAADLLRKAFYPGADPRVGSWYNHRRIRMRTLLAGIDQKLRRISVVLGRPGTPDWVGVVMDDGDDAAYQFNSEKHREIAQEILKGLAQLGRKLEDSGIDLADGAPRPESEWRPTPRV
jgi:hypothetical protein